MEHRGEKTASFVHHMRCGCGVKLKSFKAAKILQIFFPKQKLQRKGGYFQYRKLIFEKCIV